MASNDELIREIHGDVKALVKVQEGLKDWLDTLDERVHDMETKDIPQMKQATTSNTTKLNYLRGLAVVLLGGVIALVVEAFK